MPARCWCPTSRPATSSSWTACQATRSPPRDAIEAVGTSLPFLPPYSPDFNLIEQAFSKLKAHLHKAAERTIHGLWDAIGRILDLYPSQECANYFANAGYDAD